MSLSFEVEFCFGRRSHSAFVSLSQVATATRAAELEARAALEASRKVRSGGARAMANILPRIG